VISGFWDTTKYILAVINCVSGQRLSHLQGVKKSKKNTHPLWQNWWFVPKRR